MASDNSLISIGMPVYNEERYLRQTLNSLLSQDYQNFELIISDNASEDSTTQICEEYAAKDKRIRYYRNENNIGASKNFQRVFELSCGELFVWAAGHDLHDSTFLSSCIEVLSQDESIVLCYPQAVLINTEDQTLGVMPTFGDTRGLDRISRLNVVLWGTGYNYPLYGVIRSQAIKQVNWKILVGGDNVFMAELSVLGSFAHIPKPLLYIRNLDDSGKLDKYFEKIFSQPLSDFSAIALFWDMIKGYFDNVVNKHVSDPIEKKAASFSIVSCMLTKYDWLLKALVDSNTKTHDLASDIDQRLAQLVSHFCNSAIYIEEMFLEQGSTTKSSPKIIVDGVFYQEGYRTGIARVWNSLLSQWAENGFIEHIVVLDRGGTANKIPGIKYRVVPLIDYNNLDADRDILQQVCDEEGADLFVSTYYTTPPSTPSVFMAYDMIPEAMGWNLAQPRWQAKHLAIQNASAYIAISKNTARDLVKVFPHISPDSLTVAYCGVPSTFSPANLSEVNSFTTKYGISKPYCILVGLVYGYKNTDLFFQAFAKLANKQEFEIVYTGTGLSSADELSELRAYTPGNTVHILQLTDEELRAAYSGAVALVYPSKYEGFGLPVLEALGCGCPVITCPNSSIPEVAGEAAIFVNDDDVDGLAHALEQVQQPDVRKFLIAAGLEQAKKFSWSKMAQTVSSALIEATLVPLNLKEINLIVFPDWAQPEDSVGMELEGVIRSLVNHADKNRITLLVYTGNFEENANFVLSSVTMNLLMAEDVDVTDGPEISLVSHLGDLQWQAILPRLRARIILEHENQEAIDATGTANLKTSELDSLF